METAVMKVEVPLEACALCGATEDLRSLEEHEMDAPEHEHEHGAPPLRAQLLHLAHNKVLPEGRVCAGCVARGREAYSFAAGLARAGGEPLSDKIRALRRRLHDLTQKIDVFIVVGGGQEGGSYNEQDIIMVERSALAAAAAADDAELERAHNARGDAVYQCSVCPQSFQRLSEYRAHGVTHPATARHSCWTCGAQFASRAQLTAHAPAHAAAPPARCNLCHTVCQSAALLRQHEAVCGATVTSCPVDGCRATPRDRAALAQHAAATHHARATPPHLCPVCFAQFTEAEALSAHQVRHRVSRAFVCGHEGCVLRFAARAALLHHLRTSHAPPAGTTAPAPAVTPAPAPPAAVPCPHCYRTFGSTAAMRRHARVHRAEPAPAAQNTQDTQEDAQDTQEDAQDTKEMADDGLVYYEIEALEDVEDQDEEMEYKPDL